MDKLTIINRALIATGNNRINALYDGSDEWLAASESFDRAVEDLISRHRWQFATETADLAETDDNPSQIFDDGHAFLLTPSIWNLRSVWYNGVQNQNYEIIGRTLCQDYDTCTIIYIANPADSAVHPQAAEIITEMVEIGLLRSLNEDNDEAYRRLRTLEETRLPEARSSIDQQNPSRAIFYSSIREARRGRRG